MERKTGKRALAALLSLLLVVGACLIATPFAAAASNAVEDACYGCVRVLTLEYPDLYASENVSIGTGFFVDIPDANGYCSYIATNSHVIEQYADPARTARIVADKCLILFNHDPNEDARVAYPVFYNQEADIAILKLKEPTNMRIPLVLMSAQYVRRTDTVYAIGYPGVSDGASEMQIASGIEDMTVTKGTISKEESLFDGYSYLQTDAGISQGNSGGPLVTEAGYVVGVNSKGANETSTNWALWADYVMGAMNELGVPYYYTDDPTPVDSEPPADSAPAAEGTTTAAGNDSTADNQSAAGDVLGALLSLLLIGGPIAVGTVLAVRRKKKKAAMRAESAADEPHDAPSVSPALDDVDDAPHADVTDSYTPSAPSGGAPTGGLRASSSFGSSTSSGYSPSAPTGGAPAGGLRASSSFGSSKSSGYTPSAPPSGVPTGGLRGSSSSSTSASGGYTPSAPSGGTPAGGLRSSSSFGSSKSSGYTPSAPVNSAFHSASSFGTPKGAGAPKPQPTSTDEGADDKPSSTPPSDDPYAK